MRFRGIFLEHQKSHLKNFINLTNGMIVLKQEYTKK